MTHRVVGTDEALSNIDEIYGFIAAFNPSAARRLADRLLAAGISLSEFPERGRAVAPGLRELTLVWPYVLRYSVANKQVIVRRIRHGARQPD
ncbi:MAG: type II toxin-antitoxin system RelE/ParE family toxin [Sphingomicrobium sp.]|nr:type II toxin-antitoxin system RelE/ParE family toxin [Sphingomonadales bacterium]